MPIFHPRSNRTLRGDIANACRQLGITVNYSQLSDSQYLNDILIQLSDISNVPLPSGPKESEDLRQFIDTVLETMELKERKRRVKRRRVIVVVSRKSDTEGKLKVDSFDDDSDE